MAMPTTLSIRRPDDWHVHLRDGPMLAACAVHTARQFARGIIMPNLDRKSTRLNSSHSQISYAVFCLKKKTPRDLAVAGHEVQPGDLTLLCPNFVVDNRGPCQLTAPARIADTSALAHASTHADLGVCL